MIHACDANSRRRPAPCLPLERVRPDDLTGSARRSSEVTFRLHSRHIETCLVHVTHGNFGYPLTKYESESGIRASRPVMARDLLQVSGAMGAGESVHRFVLGLRLQRCCSTLPTASCCPGSGVDADMPCDTGESVSACAIDIPATNATSAGSCPGMPGWHAPGRDAATYPHSRNIPPGLFPRNKAGAFSPGREPDPVEVS